MSINLQQKEWCDRVRKHALEHYNEDGWDVLVECWDDEAIMNAAGVCRNYEQFLANVREICSVMDDRRRDVQGEVF